MNLLNKLWERDKCEAFEKSLINKVNDTGARMLDSFYHMPLNCFKIVFVARKKKNGYHHNRSYHIALINMCTYKTLVVRRFYRMELYLS